MRVVVVGGVAAGMSMAARMRRLCEDFEIVVLEAGSYVSFANCGLPYFVGGEIADSDDLLLQTPQSLKDALNLDVRINSRVKKLDTQARTVEVEEPEGVYELSYDKLMLAPGAKAVRPPIEGLDSPRVSTLRTVDDALKLRAASGQKAVVLGAGFIGLEAAEAFNLRGLETHIVELAPHVLPPLEQELASIVTDHLRTMGLIVHDGCAAKSIEDGPDHAKVTLDTGEVLEADVIVLSAGVRPDTQIFEDAGVETANGAIVVNRHGQTSVEDVYAAGDATVFQADAFDGTPFADDVFAASPRPIALAGPANRGGRLIADHIAQVTAGASADGEAQAEGSAQAEGDAKATEGVLARPQPRPLGTAVVRVGELCVASTGHNRAALDRAKVDYFTVNVHPNNHAGYFPGASTIHLVMHVAPDGQILGAQAVGQDEGAARRIDVIATAMRGGLHADDLIDLDLSYSPPFGNAKDAVNMAGMVAENVLHGRLRLATAAEVTDGRIVLDVRSEKEFATGHIAGSLNIPHTELRERLDEVREWAGDQPFTVLCAAGVRSWIGYQIVSQAGFDATMLSGGMRTLRAWYGDDIDDVLVKN